MWQKNCYRIVVKVGTSTLTHDTGMANLRSIEALVRVLADLKGYGHEVILVTSGAISVGTAKMRLPKRPTELRMKQAAAAVGQCQLMHLYDNFFLNTTEPSHRFFLPTTMWRTALRQIT